VFADALSLAKSGYEKTFCQLTVTFQTLAYINMFTGVLLTGMVLHG